jgi:hypothetical protein
VISRKNKVGTGRLRDSPKYVQRIFPVAVTVCVFINVSRLRDVAAQAGIPVQPAQDSTPLTLALSTTGQSRRLEIGERMWDQLLYELLTVPSFIDQLKLLSESALEFGSPDV